jgi:hypothetical protein
MGYDELLNEARKLLRQAIEARHEAGLHARKVGLSAYADGYMRALGDAGLLGRDELLQLVGDVRTEVDGPATAEPPIAIAS